ARGGDLDAVIVAFDADPPRALRLIDALRAGPTPLLVVAASAHDGAVWDDLRRTAGHALKYPPDVLEVLTALEGPSLAGRAGGIPAGRALRKVAEARSPAAAEETSRRDIERLRARAEAALRSAEEGRQRAQAAVASRPAVEAVRQFAESARKAAKGVLWRA